MSTRTYSDAVDHLNSLQSNAATLEALRTGKSRMDSLAIPEMVEYLGRIGYTAKDLNRLNVIHITGTKGKGSTSAFTDSILRHVKPEWKVGLYTSPHLVAVRERIRINGAPLSEDQFSQFFFDVWDRLEKIDKREHAETSKMPAYFRFVTLVAYHAFLSLGVDATILEVGVGGLPKPVVTGVSALGLDHTAVLGKTIGEIAWQKGGIYKEGVPALTVNQPEEGFEVLKQQAQNRKASELILVPLTAGLSKIELGLAGTHQYQNAGLAVHLTKHFLHVKAGWSLDDTLPSSFVEGLKQTRWPGRCQTVVDPKLARLTWFLDGAHTKESLECCMQWFASPAAALRQIVPSYRHWLNCPSAPLVATMNFVIRTRVLIFNCTNGRSAHALLETAVAKIAAQLQLHGEAKDANSFFDYVIFCTNVTYTDGGFKGDLTSKSIPEKDLAQLTTQHELAAAWSSLIPTFPSDHIHVVPSIQHAVNLVHEILTENELSQVVDVLVSGSLHLVGGVIEVADLSEVAL
ncbi:FolC bifunctional protein [Fomitopsis serialis]|uniref:FolC bifunctional protein n=1 Tax=Fomitopsis serialis TaxID=139415 RepID=UPI00200835A1|nr:FolC bifunctional protein [Neoantrodia serialis]KAH9938593.1 FolC bifunctional protein [Neoantrodia serialis]